MHSGHGATVWLTGLPSAGKSTIARLLEAEIRAAGLYVEVLDGDVVRTNLSKELGFSREDRDTNIQRIAFVCKLLSRNGVVVIAAAISPYRSTRDAARQENDEFIEVYVKCPVEVAIERDVKGLYAKALRGEIENFTGISDPYEEPLNPEVVVETDRSTPEECVAQVLTALRQRGIPVATMADPVETRQRTGAAS